MGPNTAPENVVERKNSVPVGIFHSTKSPPSVLSFGLASVPLENERAQLAVQTFKKEKTIHVTMGTPSLGSY